MIAMPHIRREVQRVLATGRKPSLVESVGSFILLLVAVLAFAVLYYSVIGGGIARCDETVEQCEAFVGPYQVH
jgi:hypothetical protein